MKVFFGSPGLKVLTHGFVPVGGDFSQLVLSDKCGNMASWCRVIQLSEERTLKLNTVFSASDFSAQFFLEHIQEMMPRGRSVMFQAAKDHETWLQEQGWQKAFCVDGIWTMVASRDIDGVSQFDSPAFSEPAAYASPAEAEPKHLQVILTNNTPVNWSVTLAHEGTVTFYLAGSFTEPNRFMVALVEMLPQHRSLLEKVFARAIAALRSQNPGCKIEVLGAERLPEELAVEPSACFQTPAGLVGSVTHMQPDSWALGMSVSHFIDQHR